MLSLKYYFHVTKEDSDILIVYGMTAYVLNATLCAPSFWMPTIHNLLDCATSVSNFGDVDAEEMFLKYPIDRSIMMFAQVDVS